MRKLLRGPRRSLRLWLLSSTLLAVLAGYGALLVMYAVFGRFQRLQAHSLLTTEILDAYSGQRPHDPRGGVPAVMQQSWPGVELHTLPASAATASPRFRRTGDRRLMVSVLAFSGPDGLPRRLRVSQDITATIAAQRLTQLLLVAGAGISTLITGALMRPILRQGLEEPIERLSQHLDHVPLPPAESAPLPLEEHPDELRPIVESFNVLLKRLISAWHQQRSFVDGVAHELRTPITLINGYAQRLQRCLPAVEKGEGEVYESLRVILSESRRLSRLVGDLLDLARQESGRLELRSTRLDLDELMLETYERLESLAAGRLRVSPPPEGELREVWADPDRLQQCIVNLVDNGLKYAGPRGPIELFVSSEGDEHVLHVRDHGPGIPDAEKEPIFQRFIRGTTSSNQKGSGIGLAMVRLLMEHMGGTARVVDVPGGGADFQLLLPAVTRGAAPPGAT